MMKGMYGILKNCLGNVAVSWGVYNTKILSETKTKTLKKSTSNWNVRWN